MNSPQRRWYVHDQHDCFDSFETASAAAGHAEWLIHAGQQGVHILYMTEAENSNYCATGCIVWGVQEDGRVIE